MILTLWKLTCWSKFIRATVRACLQFALRCGGNEEFILMEWPSVPRICLFGAPGSKAFSWGWSPWFEVRKEVRLGAKFQTAAGCRSAGEFFERLAVGQVILIYGIFGSHDQDRPPPTLLGKYYDVSLFSLRSYLIAKLSCGFKHHTQRRSVPRQRGLKIHSPSPTNKTETRNHLKNLEMRNRRNQK